MNGRHLFLLCVAVCAGLALMVATPSVPVASDEMQVLSVLGRWWSPYGPPAGSDHLTTWDYHEAPGHGTFEGGTFYIPRHQYPGTHPVYRLYQPAPYFNHLDSLFPNEGGASVDALFGYAYDDRVTGTTPLIRWKGDHPPAPADDRLTGMDTDPWAADGYVKEGPLGFGYPRYGDTCDVPIEVNNAAVAPGGRPTVRLVANRVAGGTITELHWNGKQFVNDADFGRQIQIAVFKHNVFPDLSDGRDNPTEGGDIYTCNTADTAFYGLNRPADGPPRVQRRGWSHGSPLLAYAVSGNELSTTTKPLQFIPETWGGDAQHPVIWSGTVSKKVTVGLPGHPQVIRWDATVNYPAAPVAVDAQVAVAHLVPEFTRFYVDDACQPASVPLTELSPYFAVLNGDPRAHSLDITSTSHPAAPRAGAVITATADAKYAFAIYRDAFMAWAPSVNSNIFGITRHAGYGTTGQFGMDTSAVSARSNHPGNPLNVTVYLVVGQLSDVRTEIRALSPVCR